MPYQIPLVDITPSMMGAKEFLGIIRSLDNYSLERVADDLFAPKYSNQESYMDLALGLANLKRTSHGLTIDENARQRTYQLFQDSIRHAYQELSDKAFQKVAGVIDDLIGNPQLAYQAILCSGTKTSQDLGFPNYFFTSGNTDAGGGIGHSSRRNNYLLPVSALLVAAVAAGYIMYVSGALDRVFDNLNTGGAGSGSAVTLVAPATQEIYEPTVTVTFTPQPILTISPTITSTPTATETLSPTPTSTASPTPDWNLGDDDNDGIPNGRDECPYVGPSSDGLKDNGCPKPVKGGGGWDTTGGDGQ